MKKVTHGARDELKLNAARCSVSSNGREVILSPTTFRIFRVIHDASDGVTAARIFHSIYGNHVNGGPLTGSHNIVAMVSQMNHKLAQIGICIKAHKRGAGAAYEIRDIDSKQQWDRATWSRPV
jgi:hypothetical protein